jgi:type III restriction enzyme
MRDYLTCKDECQPQLLLLESFAGIAAEKIYRAIIAGTAGRERLQLVLDPAAPIGSSSTIDFETRRNTWRTDPAKCQVNYVPIDSGWEDKMAQVLEMMPEVTAYVKNEGMNLSIPYTHEGRERRYIPDFIARIDRGPGRPPLNLVIEVTGIVSEEKEAKRGTMDALWIPGVNALAAQAYPDMGEWSHIEILDPWNARTALRDHISRTRT